MTNVINLDNVVEATSPDPKRFGPPDAWKVLAKASSPESGWVRTTKAMEIENIGCVLRVTTQQGKEALNSVAEALVFVPFTSIVDVYDGSGTLVGRRLAMMETKYEYDPADIGDTIPFNYTHVDETPT